MTPSQALGSLHTNQPSVYPLSISYLLLCSALYLSLCPSASPWAYNPLSDVYEKRFGRNHTATGAWFIEFAGGLEAGKQILRFFIQYHSINVS